MLVTPVAEVVHISYGFEGDLKIIMGRVTPNVTLLILFLLVIT